MGIREANIKDFPELMKISGEDGFEHPRKVSLLWMQNRYIYGDRFYLFEASTEKSDDSLSLSHKKCAQDGKILGFICFQPQFSDGSRLHFIAVRKSEQGKGVGTALIEEAEKMTQHHEKKKLYLWVHEKNKNAIRFYLKHEFDFSGIFLNKYGEGENALLMVKELD